MHAFELLSSVASTGAIKPSRIKDIKTAINKLAQACQLPVDELDLVSVEATYADTLKTYFATLPPTDHLAHTIRNTYQNLGQLYRAAHDQRLIADTRPPTRRHLRHKKQIRLEMRKDSPYRAIHSEKARARYGLPVKQWPSEIAATWQRYADEKSLEVRHVTLDGYIGKLSRYMGYNLQHDPFPPSHWDELFELPRLRRYIAWKATRVGAQRISDDGKHTVSMLTSIANHQERPDYAALLKFKRSLLRPAAVLNKKAPRHTVSLMALEQVGLSLMAEAHQPGPGETTWPDHALRPGQHRAIRFMTGLLIRFMLRCPRRQKEIREMDFDGRLYQDDRGTWHLHYQAHQLKIAMHDGQPNEFRMEWPPDLVHDLTEYLQVFRPMILGDLSSVIVFPARHGGVMTGPNFWHRIAPPIWDRLHKHVFPHLFRTLWCDAYLDAHPGDFEGAAAMLNDTTETVRNRYRQFRVEQHLKHATDFNAQLFGNGQVHGKQKGKTR